MGESADTASALSMQACPPDNSDPRCPAGSFAVICKDGSHEVATVFEIQHDQICPKSQPGEECACDPASGDCDGPDGDDDPDDRCRYPSCSVAPDGTPCGGANVCTGGVCGPKSPRVLGIAPGDLHTCALTSGGGVMCWGTNDRGQLGNDSATESHVPVAVSGLSAGATAVAAGSEHACALMTDGGVRCWGRNAWGQLGNGSTTDSHVPVAVSSLEGVVAIAAGGNHTCALTSGGGVQCWGSNYAGGLGNDSTTDSPVPVAVSGLASGVTAIAAGLAHTCALTSGGAIMCWGMNDGQLGTGSTTYSHVPVAVRGLGSGIVAISTSYSHTCAITNAGAATCWGWNRTGQLGNDSTANSLVPVPVSGLSSGVVAIAAGYNDTCAITSGGAVTCWGLGNVGQLGNGSTADSHVPIAVSGLSSGVTAIALGGGHACALTRAGTLACWGNNLVGQLGNDSTTNSLVPVPVRGL